MRIRRFRDLQSTRFSTSFSAVAVCARCDGLAGLGLPLAADLLVNIEERLRSDAGDEAGLPQCGRARQRELLNLL
eukprot:5908056-Pleurochrysis_carterae.AAC.1